MTKIIPMVIICFVIAFEYLDFLIMKISINNPMTNPMIIPMNIEMSNIKRGFISGNLTKKNLVKIEVTANAEKVAIDPWAKFVVKDVLNINTIAIVTRARNAAPAKP